jgi:hypothetical protein
MAAAAAPAGTPTGWRRRGGCELQRKRGHAGGKTETAGETRARHGEGQVWKRIIGGAARGAAPPRPTAWLT